MMFQCANAAAGLVWAGRLVPLFWGVVVKWAVDGSGG